MCMRARARARARVCVCVCVCVKIFIFQFMEYEKNVKKREFADTNQLSISTQQRLLISHLVRLCTKIYVLLCINIKLRGRSTT